MISNAFTASVSIVSQFSLLVVVSGDLGKNEPLWEYECRFTQKGIKYLNQFGKPIDTNIFDVKLSLGVFTASSAEEYVGQRLQVMRDYFVFRSK